MTECEALVNLIEAETAFQRRLSAANFSSSETKNGMNNSPLSQLDNWEKILLKTLALSEAELNFGKSSGGDTQINEDLLTQQVLPKIKNELLPDIKNSLNFSKTISKRMKTGLKIAILGEPNVGKSSLINAISNENLAIVTNLPGTTRDVLSVSLDIGGYPVILSDTAGIREEGVDEVERIGVERAKEVVLNSDMCLLVESVDTEPDATRKLEELIPKDLPTLKILNKIDLSHSTEIFNNQYYQNHSKISLTSNTHQPEFKTFLKTLQSKIENLFPDINDFENEKILTENRQLSHLENSIDNLESFCEFLDFDRALAVEYLKMAYKEICYIRGKEFLVEEVLDEVFGNFCIGK